MRFRVSKLCDKTLADKFTDQYACLQKEHIVDVAMSLLAGLSTLIQLQLLHLNGKGASQIIVHSYYGSPLLGTKTVMDRLRGG